MKLEIRDVHGSKDKARVRAFDLRLSAWLKEAPPELREEVLVFAEVLAAERV